MHVLITEARFGEADEVAELLDEAGWLVTRCHDRVGICRALAPAGHCEYGAVCARIPLAIVSATDRSPEVPAGLERRAAAVTRTELLDVRRTAMRDEVGVG